MPLSPGTLLGGYKILTTLGAGGIGKVYRARDPRMGGQVGVKLSAERSAIAFEPEVRAADSLSLSGNQSCITHSA